MKITVPLPPGVDPRCGLCRQWRHHEGPNGWCHRDASAPTLMSMYVKGCDSFWLVADDELAARQRLMVEEDYTRIAEAMDVCMCAEGDDAMEFVRDVLASAVPNVYSPEITAYTLESKKLAEEFHLPKAVVHLVLSFLEHNGLIEHGSSLHHSWLSREGIEVRDRLIASLGTSDRKEG